MAHGQDVYNYLHLKFQYNILIFLGVQIFNPKTKNTSQKNETLRKLVIIHIVLILILII